MFRDCLMLMTFDCGPLFFLDDDVLTCLRYHKKELEKLSENELEIVRQGYLSKILGYLERETNSKEEKKEWEKFKNFIESFPFSEIKNITEEEIKMCREKNTMEFINKKKLK